MLVRNKSIFVCVVSIIISILINYQKPLHSKEVEDIDSLISNMWDRIGNEVDGISSSKQSEYEGKLTEKFKVRGINETKLGKERIEELKTEFSKSLKKHYPKKDEAKYKSRILGVEADKRDEEINKIIQEEVNNTKSSFDNLLTNKIGEIQSEVDKVVKDVENTLIEELVEEIITVRKKAYGKLKNDVDIKIDEQKKYYNNKAQELNKKCKSSIPINVDIQKRKDFFAKCDDTTKGIQTIVEKLDGMKDMINKKDLENIKSFIEELIKKIKTDQVNITQKQIKEKVLDEHKQLLNSEIKVLQNIENFLKEDKKKFDELIKGVEDKSAELFKEIQKLLEQKKAESKMTEEEKKQKAEAEKLQKEINSFLEKSKNMTIEDDSILKNIIKCDYKEVVHNENTNIEYCSKWAIGYSAEKIYRGISENIEDLDFKLICKTKENLKLNFSGLPKNGVFIDKKVNNISDRFIATIEDKVHYSCPSDYNYVGNARCQKLYGFTCDDVYCFAWNSSAICHGCVKGCGWFCLTWDGCCWTSGIHQEGYECRGRGYNYIKKGQGIGWDAWQFAASGGVSAVLSALQNKGACVKTETISAKRHLIHIYHVNYCIPRIRDNINLGKLYDPNFVMFQ